MLQLFEKCTGSYNLKGSRDSVHSTLSMQNPIFVEILFNIQQNNFYPYPP